MTRRVWKYIILPLLVLLAFSITISFIISLPFVKQHNDIIASLVAFISVVVAVLGSLLLLALSTRENRKMRQLIERNIPFNSVNSTSTITSKNLVQLDEEQREKQEELFNVEKQQLGLEKEQLELEQEKQTFALQKEALSLVDISPRAAIIIAWIGIEQELQRIAKLLDPLEVGQKPVSSSELLKVLKKLEYIRNDPFTTLSDMQRTRNKVTHARIDEEEITNKVALDYVQQAIQVSEQISAVQQEIQQATQASAIELGSSTQE